VIVDIVYHLRELERLAKVAPTETRAEIRSTLKRIASRVEKTVIEKTPRGVGGAAGLAGSIHGEVVAYGDSHMARIGTPLEYGAVIELGRRPGQARPPRGPLILWLQRKIGLPLEEAKRVSYALAVSIGSEGFEGAHMFEKTKAELEFWIDRELQGIPDRIAERMNRAT